MNETGIIDDILKIVTATKMSELNKLCRRTVITERAFGEFIRVCDAHVLPWLHVMSWRDFLPEKLQFTSEDSSNMPYLDIGPPRRGQAKAMRKWYQFLDDRRFLVGHMFYSPFHHNWQFFYFDNRDLNPHHNHFKHGAHVHLINHLWPGHTYESIWQTFNDGNPGMKGALHIRYHREHPGPPDI
ncbi:hypothetical protein [Burkholderia pseudomallei]|uniref:hypothetical protein n=1 Tax=Burkholderia pseudomallei TaxID=28450 RepID=UPI00201ADBC8|nr:hypothetical protein [Burkholderia pseudomallei]MCL4669756.1 hypothetical protein [Burkholderia pseudomallei]